MAYYKTLAMNVADEGRYDDKASCSSKFSVFRVAIVMLVKTKQVLVKYYISALKQEAITAA